MKTVGTKLDNKDHERLLEMCNDEGKSVSEELREMVQMSCKSWEEMKEMEKEEFEEETVPELKVTSIDGVPVKSKIVGIEP